MQFCQLNLEGAWLRDLPDEVIEFGYAHKCKPSALTPEEASRFLIVALTDTPPPDYNPITQTCQRDGAEQVGGVWKYKWRVNDLDAAAAERNRIAAADSKWQEIKAERNRRKFNGVLVSGKWIHSDTFSRTQWLGMLMMGADLPAIEWITRDGSIITTTPALASGVLQAVAVMDATVFAVAAAHDTAMRAAGRPDLYDFSAGWPVTF